MGILIKKIDYFLPKKVLTNDALEKELPDWSAEKIEEKTGIKERHISADGETALDLAYNAASNVLNGYDKSNIDFIMLCTQSPEYYLPSGACILQNKLGLKTNIGAFDYNLGCSGFIYGLALAKGLVNAGIANNILLILSETYTKYIHSKDRGNRTIFGDGSAALIIENSNRGEVLEFFLGTDGSGYNNLIVPNGGLRKRYDINAPEINDGFGSMRTDNNLYMNGPDIFNYTIEIIPKVVAAVLEKNKISLADVDYIIPHQANKYILDYLRKKMNIPEDKFYINLLLTGNTVSASIPIALKNCMDNGIIKRGNLILLLGFGVGYSCGGVIIRL